MIDSEKNVEDNPKPAVWQIILLSIFLTLAAAAAIYLVAVPPRGTPLVLLNTPTAQPIFVHVDGAVLSPGVYPLLANSRVQDAILAAGGFSDDARTDGVNLAARLTDGQKISVPRVGDPIEASNPGTEIRSGNGIGLVNINTASQDELDGLPGIGPTRAADIIAYRDQNGPFTSIDELQNVAGIGEVTFSQLKDFVTVDGP